MRFPVEVDGLLIVSVIVCASPMETFEKTTGFGLMEIPTVKACPVPLMGMVVEPPGALWVMTKFPLKLAEEVGVKVMFTGSDCPGPKLCVPPLSSTAKGDESVPTVTVNVPVDERGFVMRIDSVGLLPTGTVPKFTDVRLNSIPTPPLLFPFCCTVKTCPAMVNVPVREPPELLPTEYVTLPFPEPLNPDVTVIQPAVLDAVQLHPAPAVTEILPVPPPDPILEFVGDRE